MKTPHYAIKRLQKLLKENPSADWAKDWIVCFAYQCSCKECSVFLKKNGVDIPMLDKIFG